MSLTYAFDGLGRLTSQSGYAGDGSVNRSFTYDDLSRLETATGPWEKASGAATAVTWSYAYDALGNLRTQTSNRSPSYQADNRTWHYDHATKPRALTWFEQQGKPNELLSYTSGGEVYSVSRGPSNPQDTLVWNTIGKLRSMGGSQYSYDAFDDLVKTVSTVGSASTTLIQVGDDFEYDTSGRATKYFSVNGVRIASLGTVYTADNASLPPALRQGLRLVEPLAAPAAATLFGLALVSLVLVTTRRRTPAWAAAPGVGVLAFALVALPHNAYAAPTLPTGGPGTLGRPNEPFLAYLTDHLGSTRATVNQNGIVVETRDYDPWGQTTSHAGVFAVNHRFTGQPQDEPAGGLHNYGARFYNPKWGRFVSPDEAVQGFDSQGLNPFTYVLNQPTSATDPTGHFFSFPSFSLGSFSGATSVPSIFAAGGTVSAAPTYPFPSGLVCDDFGSCRAAPLESSSQLGGGDALSTIGTLTAVGRAAPAAESVGLGSLVWGIVWGLPAMILMMPGTAQAPTIDRQQSEDGAPERSIDDPASLKGATPEEVEEAAREAGLTTKEPLTKGNGVKLSNPATPGRTVQINKGYPGGSGVHGGPYAKITGNGPTVRVPLKGNPTLR